jgi:hypothetical protein
MSRVFLQMLTVAQLSKKFSAFMELDVPLPCPQEAPLVPVLSHVNAVYPLTDLTTT